MDQHLMLAAQSFGLAPNLQHSDRANGLRVVKNVSAKTYLLVTKTQWRILELFAQPRTVPSVLSQSLDERTCLPLGEFYELVLKAIRANVLVEPGTTVPSATAYRWRLGLRPKLVIWPLLVLFGAGTLLSFALRPSLPASVVDAVIGLLVVSAALSLGSIVSACIVRGAGGEIYALPWRWWRLPPYFALDTRDAIMLPTLAQRAAALAQPAMLATAAGGLAWRSPAQSFIPLVALALSLRPILGGPVATLIRFKRSAPLSDAEHDHIFPPNHRPEIRWTTFVRAVRHADNWARLVYGLGWAFALVYLGARLTETPPWTLTFWTTNGLLVAFAVGGSLAALVATYLGWEFYRIARELIRTRRSVLRRWYRRWFGGKKLVLLEGNRVQAVNSSAVFRSLPPPDRQQIARQMQVTRHAAWRPLPEYGPAPAKVSLIVSGKVGLYRKLPSGQLRRVQLLSEGDVVGLHDAADPRHPEYFVRTLTPVTFFTIDRAALDALAVSRMPRTALTNSVLKLPFLRQIALCQHWHYQAIERFAALSIITEFAAGSVISTENHFNQEFYVIFENVAEVSHNGKKVGTIQAGDFFGEIGLLQNSPAAAQVSVKQPTRCLSIDRIEFLRFVTHNYTVALELERVSSKRLGYPIFPLKKGNFRSL
jgi:CRP-like cAMP-binding protein